MKIRFIKEYVAVDPVPTSGIIHRYRVGETEEITPYTAQWLIDNGFAEEVKESGWWKPKLDEMYYFLDGYSKACVQPWLNDELDDIRYSMGNVFKTRETAERYRDYLKAIATVRQDEGVLTPEQTARFNNGYYIGVRTIGPLEVLSLDKRWCCRAVNVILFDTVGNARASLEKHLDEWLTIANYDWSRE